MIILFINSTFVKNKAMNELQELYMRELVLILNKNLSIIWLGNYISFHNTLHKYMMIGSYGLLSEVLTKLGEHMVKHMDITFGLSKDETEKTLIQIF